MDGETPKVHSKKNKRSSSRSREQQRRRDSSRKSDDVAGDESNVVPPSITIEDETTKSDEKIHKGIMDRTLKVPSSSQTLSALETPRSPAQRSNRSRASSDKSPKHKRSKSESRRRRERKLQAVGEMEVRQANETLMRYLKQCSDLNDASGSLSGDLEISENLDDRKVHRKTKSQRERKSFRLMGKTTPSDSLTTILNELNDDIIPNTGEIYNPFTPVVSPTTDHQHVDKIFVQTSSGYRAVDNNNSFYKNTASDGDDSDSNNFSVNNAIQLSCYVQKCWINISTICHGLLSGMALAHLIFILTTTADDWSSTEKAMMHYELHTKIYTNVFFFLAVICFVSVMDRIDICQFSMSSLLSTSENKERSISFRSIILIMIYAGTIILNLLAASIDDRFTARRFQFQNNTTASLEGEVSSNNHATSTEETIYLWNTLSIARSCSAILGWIMVSSMNTNLLYATLVEMEKYHT